MNFSGIIAVVTLINEYSVRALRGTNQMPDGSLQNKSLQVVRCTPRALVLWPRGGNLRFLYFLWIRSGLDQGVLMGPAASYSTYLPRVGIRGAQVGAELLPGGIRVPSGSTGPKSAECSMQGRPGFGFRRTMRALTLGTLKKYYFDVETTNSSTGV